MPLACVIFNMSSCVPSAENFASKHTHYLAIPPSRRDLKRETRQHDFIAVRLALWAALAVVLLISSYLLLQKKYSSITVAFAKR
jgi:hypothetical protein